MSLDDLQWSYQRTGYLLGGLLKLYMKSFPMSSLKPLIGIKSRHVFRVYDCFNKFQIVLKENSGLPLDVDSTQMAFNPMFANGLCCEFSLLVKRTGTK